MQKLSVWWQKHTSLQKAPKWAKLSTEPKWKYWWSNSNSHPPVLDIFPKAMDTRGSQSTALPVSEQPGSQRAAPARGESRYKFITLFHTENEALMIRPQNTHSRVNLSYWWYFLSYGVTVNFLDEEGRESDKGSVVTLGSVTWDMNTAVSRQVCI